MEEKRARRIHLILIVLIVVLGIGLLWELYHQGIRWISKEMGIKPQRRGYIVIPSDPLEEWEEWDPYKEMDRIQRRMERWFERVWRSMPGIEFRKIEIFEPDIDLTETDTEYVVVCDLPGMSKDEIDVSISRNYLTISGTRNIRREETGRRYCYQERRCGYFKRTILLPGPVDENNVKAEYEKGILTIRIPKKKPVEEIRPKKVQII